MVLLPLYLTAVIYIEMCVFLFLLLFLYYVYVFMCLNDPIPQNQLVIGVVWNFFYYFCCCCFCSFHQLCSGVASSYCLRWLLNAYDDHNICICWINIYVFFFVQPSRLNSIRSLFIFAFVFVSLVWECVAHRKWIYFHLKSILPTWLLLFCYYVYF